jgi:archaellum component FlaC
MAGLFLQLAYGFAAEPVRKPFVEISINGQTYSPGQKASVRPGEKVKVTAILRGGKRDYCSMPEKYANIGANTQIVSKGEDGMFFTIQGGGQFRGEWKLANETALFSSSEGVVVEPLQQQGVKQMEAFVTLPKSGLGQTFLKVKVNALWKYQRTTPAGTTNTEEANTGEDTFYLTLSGAADAWYSSENLVVSGTENFSVRNKLDQVQRFYKEIEAALKAKNFNGVQMQIDNLKSSLSSLKSEIERQKQDNKTFECNVSLLGSPTDLSMDHINKLQKMADLWKSQFSIAQENTLSINQILLKKQIGLTNNIMKSVIKNYIDWANPIPSDATDLISLYNPSQTLGFFVLPMKFLSWNEQAREDATILKDQVNAIQMLTELRTFYQERTQKSVEERKLIVETQNSLLPVKAIDSQLKGYFSGLTWLKWTPKK